MSNNVVKVFSENGKFVRSFGQSLLSLPNGICIDDCGKDLCSGQRQGSGDGEFQNPTGLALDKAGNLLICDDYNHRVQVFSEDGAFITKFGSYGQELGQLGLPSGVAVLNDGRIVVAEFRNNRVQFFN
ncbi:hypothetical protein ACROYT_G004268 [Oculina patagonica]